MFLCIGDILESVINSFTIDIKKKSEVVKLLLKHGANVNDDNFGKYLPTIPFHYK